MTYWVPATEHHVGFWACWQCGEPVHETVMAEPRAYEWVTEAIPSVVVSYRNEPCGHRLMWLCVETRGAVREAA